MINMNSNKLRENLYVKYIVKSTKLFYICLIIFVFFFIIIGINMKLDVKKSFLAQLKENRLSIDINEPINIKNKKIYLYKDKSKQVVKDKIKKTFYENGKQYIEISKSHNELKDKVTIEVVTSHDLLLKRIFIQAGTSS